MARIVLEGPDSYNKPPATRDETKENGWSIKRIVDSINDMMAELYADDAAEANDSTIKYVDVTVSSAELLALNATPKEIVAAPGAGLAVLLESIALHKPAGTAYAGIAAGEDLAVKYTDSAGAVQATIETTGFLDQATAQSRHATAYRAASGVNSFTPTNTPLVLQMLTGEITTGTSALLLRVYYRTVPTTLS